MVRRKKVDKLFVRIHFEGNSFEGEFDFDAVVNLKNLLLKYLWTGKRDPIFVWNMEKKYFSIIDPAKICAIEVEGSLMFLDDIPEKRMELKSLRYEERGE
ncbi:hypothetical protein [Methanocaldococcus infernus]|uniref:Uncharacterized protein n=1 Tax=Methanocaldococcus infernus (strain DSM 11812 / JCM 15783 / ME) TaxID=573063 RepID=D5VQY3_METIM|nr:hypothetical protein [Methanocaldococcus infernus]ADG12986.1 conserved hypothetical protein [Methanocaldococcus infernus ME]